MASCISWSFCCISCWRWAPVGRMLPLVNPRRALYPIVDFSFNMLDFSIFDAHGVKLTAELDEHLHLPLVGGDGRGRPHDETDAARYRR